MSIFVFKLGYIYLHNCHIIYLFGVNFDCYKLDKALTQDLLVLFNDINRNVVTFIKFLFDPLLLSYFVDRFDSLGLLPENSKYIIWFSNISIWSLPDEGYSRNCRAVSGSSLPWLFKCKMYLLSKLSPPPQA